MQVTDIRGQMLGLNRPPMDSCGWEPQQVMVMQFSCVELRDSNVLNERLVPGLVNMLQYFLYHCFVGDLQFEFFVDLLNLYY